MPVMPTTNKRWKQSLCHGSRAPNWTSSFQQEMGEHPLRQGNREEENHRDRITNPSRLAPPLGEEGAVATKKTAKKTDTRNGKTAR